MRPRRQKLERAHASDLRFAWPPQLAKLLGRIADVALAKKAGVHPDTVEAERRRRGIPPFRARRPPFPWPKDHVALLGTMPDRALGGMLEMNHACVTRKRQQLGIPPYGPAPAHVRPDTYPWPPEALALLGKHSDRQVARHLGIATPTVHRKRDMLGIPPVNPRAPNIRWTKKMVHLLGRLSDRAIALRFGISTISVEAKRGELRIPPFKPSFPLKTPPSFLALLKKPNHLIQEHYDVSSQCLARLRRKNHIAPPERQRRSAWTEDEDALLGLVPDAELVVRLSRTLNAIRRRRHRLRIPFTTQRRGPQMKGRLRRRAE